MSPVFSARVSPHGELILDQREPFYRHVNTFAGKPVEVLVRPPRKARSDRQNRYYWSTVVAILGDHLGYTRDEMHDALKYKFLRDESQDSPLVKVRSTTDLSTAEMERYLADVRTFALTEFNCYIPEPNEVDP